jgi:hypothetical protein
MFAGTSTVTVFTKACAVVPSELAFACVWLTVTVPAVAEFEN